MASDQEIAKGVETVLRQSDPNAVTSLNGVVKQLEAKLGLDLSHKAGFIADHISLLLRSHPQPPPPSHHHQSPKDHFFLQRPTQFQNPPFAPHFAFQHPQLHPPNHLPEDLNFRSPPPPVQLQPPSQPQPQPPPPQQPKKFELNFQSATASASAAPKER